MDTDKLTEALKAPFDPREVKFKPGAFSADKERALALAYVDARAVMDRLDGLLGIDGWEDEYAVVENGVLCRLSLLIGGQWITRSDVGSFSEQPDDGDKLKAAVSDALKRAAVKFGVGRYLYRFPQQWLAWDTKKRAWKEKPKFEPEPEPKESLAAARDRAWKKFERFAKFGLRVYEIAWNTADPREREACKVDHPRLKEMAAARDAELEIEKAQEMETRLATAR